MGNWGMLGGGVGEGDDGEEWGCVWCAAKGWVESWEGLVFLRPTTGCFFVCFFCIRELVSPLYHHNTLQLVLLCDHAPPSSTRCDIRGRPGDEHQDSVPLKVPTAEKCAEKKTCTYFVTLGIPQVSIEQM